MASPHPLRSDPSAGGIPPVAPPHPTPSSPSHPQTINQPSAFYRPGIWQFARAVARRLPRPLVGQMTAACLAIYRLIRPGRREVVFQNLLPPLDNDRAAADTAADQLFHQFALKLTDLWRYESGLPICDLFHELSGWEHFLAAQEHGRGILFLTIHLGNWEFGAPLLTQRGVKLQVITQAEPHQRLTELRQNSRSFWGVETLALGADPFAPVEIIRRLEENRAVALLMDRPPPATATPVTLFGRSFFASKAAAELARACGCALLPVFLPRTSRGYVAHLLPEIPYDRKSLRNPAARTELTQRIMDSFASPIRLHANQWFHFVPVWPVSTGRGPIPPKP